jgi:hypothetical protein
MLLLSDSGNQVPPLREWIPGCIRWRYQFFLSSAPPHQFTQSAATGTVRPDPLHITGRVNGPGEYKIHIYIGGPDIGHMRVIAETVMNKRGQAVPSLMLGVPPPGEYTGS